MIIHPMMMRPKAAPANWWQAAGVNPVAAWAGKGAASQSASYSNLANPGTYDLSLGSAPTWNTATGWYFDGDMSARYLRTGFTPTSENLTMIVKFSGANTGETKILLGGITFDGNTRLTYLGAGANTRYGNGWYADGASAVASGVIGVAGHVGYLNGSVDVASIDSSPSTTWNELFLGAADSTNGQSTAWIRAYITSAWIATSTLDASQMATQMAAMI